MSGLSALAIAWLLWHTMASPFADAAIDSNTSLRAAGKQRGIYMGSQFKLSLLTNCSDPEYSAMHAEQVLFLSQDRVEGIFSAIACC